MACILHIDDDEQLRSLLRAVLEVQGHEIVSATDGRQGLERFREQAFDLVVSDIQMPVMDGLQVLSAIRNERPDTPVVMATSVDTIKTALDALKVGAFDYVIKPFKVPVLVDTIERALAFDSEKSGGGPSGSAMSEYYAFPDVVAVSDRMRAACDLVRRVAPLHTPHLITGEAGTGRGLLAQAIHRLSARRDGRFIRFECCLPGAPGQGAASEQEDRLGVALADANGGTLLLVDVEALSLDLQGALLDVIYDGAISSEDGQTVALDVRVLASTRNDLRALVEAGAMKDEFVSVLTRIPIVTAPLCERGDDILPLTWHFLVQLAPERSAVPRIARSARAALEHYEWPRNANELFAAVQHAFQKCSTGTLGIGDLPAEIMQALENLDLGRSAPDEEGQRGQAFRHRLAERLADQLRKGSTPSEQGRPTRPAGPANAELPAEATPGAYVLSSSAGSAPAVGQAQEASAQPGPEGSQGSPALNAAFPSPPPPPSPRPATGREDPAKRRTGFGARLRSAFRALLSRG